MSIINFSFDHEAESYAEGAHCPLHDHWTTTEGRKIILWETHQGLCLSEREANYYDDSDFYMAVWNEEKQQPESIMFASTRGWSYPALGSFVDATPEIIAKWEAWKAVEMRRVRIQQKWLNRHKHIQEAQAAGLTRKQLTRLRNSLNDGDFHAVYKLLKTRNFRSKFRKSCAEQVREWLANEASEYKSPLSKNQLSYLW